jgi:hypothetical protein
MSEEPGREVMMRLQGRLTPLSVRLISRTQEKFFDLTEEQIEVWRDVIAGKEQYHKFFYEECEELLKEDFKKGNIYHISGPLLRAVLAARVREKLPEEIYTCLMDDLFVPLRVAEQIQSQGPKTVEVAIGIIDQWNGNLEDFQNIVSDAMSETTLGKVKVVGASTRRVREMNPWAH